MAARVRSASASVLRMGGNSQKATSVCRGSRSWALSRTCASTIFRADPEPVLYLPHEQFWDWISLRVVVRTAGDPSNVAALLRTIVASLDRGTAVSDVRPYAARAGDTIARPRFTAQLLGAFAAVAVFLAGVGIYGVLSYALSRRIPEIGVRVAFGASRRAVFGLLFGQGLRVTLVGVAVGIPLAIGASHLLSSLLFGVDPFGVGTLAAVALGVIGVGAAVSCWPALAAARVDPMQALRDQ